MSTPSAPVVESRGVTSRSAPTIFEMDAENFLRDSLRFTHPGKASRTASASELAALATVGRFGPPSMVTPSDDAALLTRQTLQKTFGSQATDLRFALAELANEKAVAMKAPPLPPSVAATPALPAPASIAAALPLAAVPIAAVPAVTSPPVRVATTMVVPLPSHDDLSDPTAQAPIPVVPLERSRASQTTVFSEMGAPVEQQASIPPVTRAPPVAMPGIGRNDGVAVYDISAAMVYLPNGERLEAHSGLGNMVDNPRYVDRRNVGSTPPNTYNLVPLESRFHGVEALRMVPVNGSNTFGRDGFLTHTYMLRGRPGESNGCVVFPDYQRFLNAFKRGAVRKLVVVASLRGQSPMSLASR